MRLSTVEPRLLGLMHNQWTSATFPGEGVVVAHQLGRREARGQALEGEGEARVWRCRAPVLPDLRSRGGFTFLLWVVCEGSGNGGFRGDEGDLGLGRRFFRPGSRVAWGKEEYSSALDENLTDQSVCKGAHFRRLRLCMCRRLFVWPVLLVRVVEVILWARRCVCVCVSVCARAVRGSVYVMGGGNK